jgi:hypothetical protein
MFAILFAAVLSSTPSITSPESGFAGDLVATWSHANAEGRTLISLDADGRCSITGQRNADEATFRSTCGYWIRGSSVFLRLRTDAPGPRPELVATYDRDTDQLTIGNDVFSRSPLDERHE